jgi:regulator of protease activity HflC (stomatin/prohibitin superfamily)
MTKSQVLGVAAVIVLILLGVFAAKLVGYKQSTELLVKQSPFGTLSCVEGQGLYFKGFASIYKYDLAKSFYFNSSTEKVNGEGWEGDEDDEDDISVTLSRNANADISGYLMYELPTDCDKLIELHKNQRSDKGVKHNLVRNAVLSAVRKTAPLFTAEEAKVTKIAEFRRLAEDQLVEGEYLTTIEVLKEKAGEDEVDSTGKVIKKAEVQEYRVTKLKLDKDGHRIITKKSPITQYGIVVKQLEIQNVKLDPKAQQQLDIVKEREMQRVANATAAETAKQKAITAKAEGDAKIAEAKATQEVQKMTEVTMAEKEKAVAILNAEREKEVARLEALKAIEVAKKIKAEKEAEAQANRALVAAGLTPQERAEWEYKTKVGVAEALAKSSHPLVPEIMMTGSDGKNGASNAMDAVGLNMLMDLTSKLSNK